MATIRSFGLPAAGQTVFFTLVAEGQISTIFGTRAAVPINTDASEDREAEAP